MGLFSDPEVIILKESCDSADYLNKLQELRISVPDNSKAAEKIDREIAITEAGIFGEDSVLFELKNSGMDLAVIRDLYLETSDGRNAQIDFFVATPYVNVVIECKNLFGNIEINNKGDFIRSYEYRGHRYKEGIYSPITQNERHLTVFKDCRKARKNALLKYAFEKNFDDYYKSVVVLANPKTIVNDKWAKREVKQQVIRCDQLIRFLKSLKSDLKSNKKQIRERGERALALNVEERKDYFRKFEDLSKEMTSPQAEEALEKADEQSLICPRCGSKLVLRTAKKGDNAGNQFYGCSAFPKCRYIQNVKNPEVV